MYFWLARCNMLGDALTGGKVGVANSLSPRYDPLCTLPRPAIEFQNGPKGFCAVVNAFEAGAGGSGVYIKTNAVIGEDELAGSSALAHCYTHMRAMRMPGGVGDKFLKQKPEMSPFLHRRGMTGQGFGEVDGVSDTLAFKNIRGVSSHACKKVLPIVVRRVDGPDDVADGSLGF